MKIGAMQSILRVGDASAAIERAAEWGFEAIELICKSGPNGEPLPWDDEEKRAIRETLHRTGIWLSSFCVGSFNRCGLVDPGPVGMERIRESLKEITRIAEELGAGVILVPFFGRNAIKNEDDRNRVVEGVSEAAPIAEKCEVILALEMTASADMMRDIVERIDNPFVKLYYDIGNMRGAGFDNASVLRELGELVAAVHIKDRPLGGPNVPLGEGDVDFESVRDALKEIGYDRSLILETPAGQNPEVEAKRNLSFVKSIWG